jgi:hypothetical protein
VPWTLPGVADSLVDLLSSDTWDLTDVEVRGGGGGVLQECSALDVNGSAWLPADLLSSDTWDLTDVEVRGRGEGGGHIGSDCGCERVLGGCVEFTDWLCDLSRCHTRVPSSTPPHPERCCGAH